MANRAIKYFFHSRIFIVIGLSSLILNVVLISWYLIVNTIHTSGELDTAQVNYSIALMCSDEYRYKYEHSQTSPGDTGKKQLALLNYTCAKEGAGPYFEKGYNEYIQTLGLKP